MIEKISNTKAVTLLSTLKSSVGTGTAVYPMEKMDQRSFQKIKDDSKNLPMYVVIQGIQK